jgi:hypothetical protein
VILGGTLGGELEAELFDEELLNFVGRGISAKDKPTAVSGCKPPGKCRYDRRLGWCREVRTRQPLAPTK